MAGYQHTPNSSECNSHSEERRLGALGGNWKYPLKLGALHDETDTHQHLHHAFRITCDEHLLLTVITEIGVKTPRFFHLVALDPEIERRSRFCFAH